MKISGITVYEVKPRWIFVKITTDEGIEGWGEMISGTKTETVVAGAKEMGEYVLGRDPIEIELRHGVGPVGHQGQGFWGARV